MRSTLAAKRLPWQGRLQTADEGLFRDALRVLPVEIAEHLYRSFPD
jgi:hypothetical protein